MSTKKIKITHGNATEGDTTGMFQVAEEDSDGICSRYRRGHVSSNPEEGIGKSMVCTCRKCR